MDLDIKSFTALFIFTQNVLTKYIQIIYNKDTNTKERVINMYLKMENPDLIKEVNKKTGTTYEINGEFLNYENIEPMIEDLLNEISRLKERLEDEKEQRENYYRPLTQRELGAE